MFLVILSMMKVCYVKHSIVMANGVQAMKDIAYFVTKDIEDDGIAYALEKLELI